MHSVLILCGSFLAACVSMTMPAAPTGDWEAEIAAFEAADLADPPASGAVLFTGSSSIRLWPALPSRFAGATVIQRGFGGSQLVDLLFYSERVILPLRPRQLIVYAGDNDLAEGADAQQILSDFQRLVAHVQTRLPETRIAFISIKPSPARRHLLDEMRVANSAIAEFAMTHSSVSYIDVFTAMLDADGEPRPELYATDGLHLNEAGYTLWTELIDPHVCRDPPPPCRRGPSKP